MLRNHTIQSDCIVQRGIRFSSCCLLRLNLARSNIKFFLTWKNASNLLMTESYFFLSSSLMLVEARTSSASSPRQVLTCLTSGLLARSEATRNCSKHFFHFGQFVWLLEVEAAGGFQLELCCGHPDTAATM